MVEVMFGFVVVMEVGDVCSCVVLWIYGEGVVVMVMDLVKGWLFGVVLLWIGLFGFWYVWGVVVLEVFVRVGVLFWCWEWLVVVFVDVGCFILQVLVFGGLYNVWVLFFVEVQIVYGVYGCVVGVFQVVVVGGVGLCMFVGLVVGWFFGVNIVGVFMYDFVMGVMYDGVEMDGRVNCNFGVELMIYGLFMMFLLDVDCDVVVIVILIMGFMFYFGLCVVDVEMVWFFFGCVIE